MVKILKNKMKYVFKEIPYDLSLRIIKVGVDYNEGVLLLTLNKQRQRLRYCSKKAFVLNKALFYSL